MIKQSLLIATLATLPLGSVCQAQRLQPQALEQTLVHPKPQGRYLWLPIQDSAPEGKVQVILDNCVQAEHNIRLARERVDYYLPLDFAPYQGACKGTLKVAVQMVPTGSIAFQHLVQNDDPTYKQQQEAHRPAFHHAPQRGWMNDPNGLFYLDGTWHLYYQYNPYGSTWGNMHWGHATSTDLIHWTPQPVALAPDAWGTIFSGSAVVDHEGTAGFGRGAVVAMYTNSRPTSLGGDVQAQSLAYSTDGGHTFQKYSGNPVLTAPIVDFRDPKVFWNADLGLWNLILAAGQEMIIYTSPNLKEWHEESRFGQGLGNHGGVWECPDLFPLPVEGQKGKTKWVLICSINPGGPFGGSATQYFIGDFNGRTFTPDNPQRYTQGRDLWMDYGKDHYAVMSVSNAPEGRRTVIAWMSNWQYANEVPTRQFRSANTLARDLFLYQVGQDVFLGSRPAKEYDGKGLDQTYKLKGSQTITLRNAQGEEFHIIYDQKAMTLTCDRSLSGQTRFSEHFPVRTVAPVRRPLKSLRVFVDRSSVEVFGNNGEVVLTNLVFLQSNLQ